MDCVCSGKLPSHQGLLHERSSMIHVFCSFSAFIVIFNVFPLLLIMSDLYVKELEQKVARYEMIMSNCPQCKNNLPSLEVEPATVPPRQSRQSRSEQQPATEVPATLSPRQSRLSRSEQQPATKVPAPALIGSSKMPTSTSTLPSSAISSKQLPPQSRTQLQASDLDRVTSVIPSATRSSRSHQGSKARVSTLLPSQTNSSDHPSVVSAASLGQQSSGDHPTSSRRLGARPSSPQLSTSDGRQPHTGKLVALDSQLFTKSGSRIQGGRPPNSSKQPEWMRRAKSMLEEVPSGLQWRGKIIRMDSSVLAAVAMSVTHTSSRDASRTRDDERKELVRLVRNFAERHSEGRINFQHFILVCLCNVLLSQGIPHKEIVKTLQICISDTSRENMIRYLKGAIWVNRLMCDLFFTDWGYRAVDLIPICKILIVLYKSH